MHDIPWQWIGVLLVLAACTQPNTAAAPGNASQRASGPTLSHEPVSLEINGFNYTDLSIDSFEVNGQGGGNLMVSTPETGGGKGVCCILWRQDSTPPVKLTIKWTRDRKRWCEQEVPLTSPVPTAPRHLGVHFFPDGHIEAELAKDYPDVKLPLERVSPDERKASSNTVADERLSRCKDGY